MSALLSTIRGQETAVATLERALAAGRVASAYLFDGPSGVGKELAAFALAQALVCEKRGKDGTACGTCSACARAMPTGDRGIAKHPDVIVLGRGIYSPEAIGRRTPETQELSIDQVRTLVLARFAFPPHEGRARIFIVRDADEMSTSAANALLKVLEEPGNDTHFVLLSSRPDALLPTIRSRTLRVRFAPLPEKMVAELLVGRVAKGTESAAARLSRGSVGAGLLASNEEDLERKRAFVERATAAVSSETLREAFELGEEAKKSKDQLPALLSSLAAHYWDARSSSSALVASRRYREVQKTLGELDGNASPQLAIEKLFMRLRATH